MCSRPIYEFHRQNRGAHFVISSYPAIKKHQQRSKCKHRIPQTAQILLNAIYATIFFHYQVKTDKHVTQRKCTVIRMYMYMPVEKYVSICFLLLRHANIRSEYNILKIMHHKI